MFRKIKKNTEKIRFNIVSLIIKQFTPSLYKNILPIIKRNWSNTPRPAILFMKMYFNKNIIIGAEIGVDKGKNAESILKELNIKELYLIDAWFNYGEIESNRLQNISFELVLKKFKNNKKIIIIKDFSMNAVKKITDNSLDFVYIDANHSFKFVYQDIKLWYSKIKKNGIIAGHDIYNHSGVLKAVMMFCNEKEILFKIDVPDWYFIKNK